MCVKKYLDGMPRLMEEFTVMSKNSVELTLRQFYLRPFYHTMTGSLGSILCHILGTRFLVPVAFKKGLGFFQGEEASFIGNPINRLVLVTFSSF